MRKEILFLMLILVNFASAATSGRAIYETSNFSIFVDNTAPVVTILSPGNLTYSSPVFVNYTIFDHSLNFVWYSLNNGVNISITDNFYLNLSNGGYNLKIYANDSFKRINFSEVNFNVDNNNSFCGDAICGTSESCSNCAVDCGACPIVPSSGSGGGGGGGSEKPIAKNATQDNITSGNLNETEIGTGNIEETEEELPITPNKKTKSGFKFILIIFLILIILVTYYLYNHEYFDKWKDFFKRYLSKN